MKRRRLLRYSLRTMLVVVLVLSVWLGYMANRAAKQRRAVALVEELGGEVRYAHEYRRPLPPGLWSFVESEPPGPAWLRDALGKEWFTSVHWVNLGLTQVTDEQLAQIADDLPELEDLFVHATPIGDSGLEHLTSLRNLSSIDLTLTKITNHGLRHLRECPTLTALNLSGNRQITDEGLVHIGALDGMRFLRLHGTNVTDVGLAHLRDLKQIEVLSVDGKVSDAGLVYIGELVNLKELSLGGTRITDAGLAHLAKLSELEVLALNYTRVTTDGIARLEGRLPNIEVHTGRARRR